MVHPASDGPPRDETTASLDAVPSLDPTNAIEQAYRLERARRRAKVAHRDDARNSNARFWVVLAVLILITVVLAEIAFHQVQTMFGI